MDIKEKMEDLWLGVKSRLWLNSRIRDVCWEIRYGFERMFKGYDSVDTFETYAKFIERYQKILLEYKKNHLWYPTGMSESEWEDIVDEMIRHLRYMDENNVIEELCKGMPKDYVPDYNVVDDIAHKHKDEFFNLFSKYFYHLWD